MPTEQPEKKLETEPKPEQKKTIAPSQKHNIREHHRRKGKRQV
jgi:hypothetical protein